MRRDRRRGGGAQRRSRRQFGAGQDPVQRGAVAGERARGVRRRGAGNRGARACRCARPDHRQGAGGRQPFDRRDRRGGGGRGPRPDRRCHRRADHRQGDRDGRRQAADGDQPPRGACADGAAHLGRPVSLLPVPRLRRPHPDRRGAGRSATTRCSAPPRTTRSARPSTRPRSCWGWAIRAARRWRRKRCGEILRALRCRGRCRGGPSRIFRCRD